MQLGFESGLHSRLQARALDLSGSNTLDIAARSVMETFGLETDLSTVVAERALRHAWEGLRQYLTIRVDESVALEVLARLEQSSTEHAAAMTKGGPRATLYAAARRAFDNRPPRLAPDDSAWYQPRTGSSGYAKKLAALRRSLTANAFEIAELAYARRLRLHEIAFVVCQDESAVTQALSDTEQLARKLLGDEPPSLAGTLEGALLEAFALASVPLRPKPRVPLLSAGDVIASRYRVEAHLGTGAFADVYRATDCDVPGHVVALKLFRRLAVDTQAREAALRELRLIASVSHPSVVQFKDHGWHEGHVFFVMPFYRGETLRQRLSRGPLSRLEAKDIFVPLSRALSAMHAAGVRHQDIKPENIFLAHPHDDDEKVLPVLIDLGVAAKDAENVLAGTPNYFAPEVAARFGREPDPPLVTGKADVFSLALALRNALDPDAAEDVAAGAVDAFVQYRARRAPLPSTRKDLVYLKASFERWLHLAPDARPTASELSRELSVLTLPEERRARTLGTLRWVVPIVAMVAVVASALIYGFQRRTELHRIEAARALEVAELERTRAETESTRAANVRADLAQALETSRALKENVALLEEKYRTSRLTRIELAGRLAHTEGALSHLTKQRDDEVSRLSGELAQTRTERDGSRAAHEETQESLASERERVALLEKQLAELRAELDGARQNTNEARARMGQLELSLAALRASLAEKTRQPTPAKREPAP